MSQAPTSAAARRKTLVIGWSYAQGALDGMRESPDLVDVAACVVTPTLAQALKTALSRAECVVVLHLDSPREHDQIEEFLHAIDRSNKVNSHFVIVVSAHAKRFKSGVQSHSVINSFDPQAITRAILHGIAMMDSPGRQGVEPAPEQGAEGDDSNPRKPSLLEYFKIPAFPRPSAVLASLSNDERERLALALSEMNRVFASLGDPLERAAQFLRKTRSAEVAVLKGAEALRFAPVSRMALAPEMVPLEGSGVLAEGHELYRALGVRAGEAIRFFWAEDLKCYVIAWSSNVADSAFAQALIYTVLRLRLSRGRSGHGEQESAA